jgi:hypothetical protein
MSVKLENHGDGWMWVESYPHDNVRAWAIRSRYRGKAYFEIRSMQCQIGVPWHAAQKLLTAIEKIRKKSANTFVEVELVDNVDKITKIFESTTAWLYNGKSKTDTGMRIMQVYTPDPKGSFKLHPQSTSTMFSFSPKDVNKIYEVLRVFRDELKRDPG